MHDIEPYFKWRDLYIASEDEQSPFFERVYNEFQYTQKIYNYYIHPQWDFFGSPTLYMKILFVDYDEGYAILEFIGEWNDLLNNDIMYLKREIVDSMTQKGIYRFVLLCDHVLNFHGSDDCYYEEWWDDIKEEGGWICLLNTFDHVAEEMSRTHIQWYANFGDTYNEVNWRRKTPELLIEEVEKRLLSGPKSLH